MNLLFVLEYYLPHIGGVEVVFQQLCEGLVRRGHHVTVITSRLPHTSKKEKINGVNVHRVHSLRNRFAFALFGILPSLKAAKNCDLIHTSTYSGALAAWVAGKLQNKKVVLTVHEVWLNKWKEFTDKADLGAQIHNLAEKFLFSLPFTAYIGVSHATTTDVRALFPKRNVRAIVNGMDYAHWNPAQYDGEAIRKKLRLEKNFVYLGYGRPGTSKGFQYLVEAVPLIQKQIPNAKLVLILSKSKAYKKAYHSLIEKIEQVKEHVLVLPPQPYNELPAYVKAADCVVVPSLCEGFGYTCVESNALGKPVVASNVASLPEVISKGVLVHAKSAKAIAEGVLAVRKGKSQTFSNKQFSWEENISQHEALYTELA